ncbi:hypothetical protein LCGC14_0619410 [marine sediment metagenome]|uniref:Uncharacterized protein n=1 Tax=marine sediment metagenome TaxID=412755 RepID=A0A0F9RA99_9ZZZZ
MKEHSKLPWRLLNRDNIMSYERNNPECVTVRSYDGWNIARIWLSVEGLIPQGKANAEYIVTACNAFPDLLAACKGVIAHLGPNGYIPGCGEPKTRAVREAIAAAEESK